MVDGHSRFAWASVTRALSRLSRFSRLSRLSRYLPYRSSAASTIRPISASYSIPAACAAIANSAVFSR